MAPRYTTRATTIVVVVKGSGYFEMACLHRSDSGRSERREHGSEEQQRKKSRGYKQVTAHIKEGSVIVLPAGYPATFVTWNEGNLAVVCFGVGSGNDEEVFPGGRQQLAEAAGCAGQGDRVRRTGEGGGRQGHRRADGFRVPTRPAAAEPWRRLRHVSGSATI
jgi:hypothetical protein